MSATHTKITETTFDLDCLEGLCPHEDECPSLTLEVCKECSDRNWDEHEGGVVLWVGHLDESDDLCLDEFEAPNRTIGASDE
ncbi:hypothetical protein [Microbacterium sp. NPDC056052]|uniref:hypothetical protein n=1 Tax=Microbacterium sp. NPDC056052 TaxID=3345695 RepID=UPI0035D865E9